MPQQLALILRRFLEATLVVLLAATGLALLRGHGSATTLGAAVPAIVAVAVTLDQLGRGRGRHYIHRADR
jgi:hypothetical protein